MRFVQIVYSISTSIPIYQYVIIQINLKRHCSYGSKYLLRQYIVYFLAGFSMDSNDFKCLFQVFGSIDSTGCGTPSVIKHANGKSPQKNGNPIHLLLAHRLPPAHRLATSTGWRPLSADERLHGRGPRARHRWPPAASGCVCSAARWEISCPPFRPAATAKGSVDYWKLQQKLIIRQVMFLLKAVVWRLAGRYRGHGYINYIYTYIYVWGCISRYILWNIIPLPRKKVGHISSSYTPMIPGMFQ